MPKLADFIIAIFVLAIGASIFALVPKDISSKNVRVKTPYGEYLFPLDIDEVYIVDGAKGETKIEVKSGRVRVLSSECPNKTCVQEGFSSHIVCLPNCVEIFSPISTKTADGKDVDAITK